MHGKSGDDLHWFACKHGIWGSKMMHSKPGDTVKYQGTVNRGLTVICIFLICMFVVLNGDTI